MREDDDYVQQAMSQGHSAAWEQRWDRAAEFYRRALDLSPNHLSAITSLALSLYQLQDYPEALRYYLQAAQLNPVDPLPSEKIAQIYEQLGSQDRCVEAALQAADLYLNSHDVDKAIENWNRVLALSPENLQAHTRLAVLYERMGKEKPAVVEFLSIASLFQRSNELEKAFQTVQHAIRVFPGNDAPRQALDLLKQGRLLSKPARPSGPAARRGDQGNGRKVSQHETVQEAGLDPIAEACQSALTVLAGMLFDAPEQEPFDSSAHRGLQKLMRGELALGERLPRQADPARILVHLSQLFDLQTQGEKHQAITELEGAIEAGLNHTAAYFDLGLLYSEVGELDSALDALQQAVKDPDYALGGRLLLGGTLSKMDRWNEAAVVYLEALCLADAAVVPVEQAEDLRQLYGPIVESQRQMTDDEAQQRLCGNIRDILQRPGWRELLRQARQQLPIQETGGYPVPFAELLTQTRSSQVVDLLSTVNQLAADGFLHSAMEEAFYALQFAPTYLPLHAYMGNLLLKQNRLTEAVAKLLVVARTYSIRGETRRAIDLYRKVIDLAPMDVQAHSFLAEQLVAVGKIEEAIQAYLDFAEVHYNLADMDMVRKAFAEALRLAQGARVDRSWRVEILYRMADIDLQRLDLRQALRNFEQIRMLQPDDEKARMKVIELNFRLGQESLALSEVDNFIAYLASKGQREKAASFLESMIQENMNDPSVHRRLGGIYVQMGRIQDAIAHYDAAGQGFLNAGDRPGAAGAVEAILKLNPRNAGEYQRLLGKLKGK